MAAKVPKIPGTGRRGRALGPVSEVASEGIRPLANSIALQLGENVGENVREAVGE